MLTAQVWNWHIATYCTQKTHTKFASAIEAIIEGEERLGVIVAPLSSMSFKILCACA
jgi:hypothetical protein